MDDNPQLINTYNICKENPSSENLQSLYNNLTQNIKDTCAKVFHIRTLVENIIKSERVDQKKFFNHARGKRQTYPIPKNISINEEIDLPEEENDDFLTQFSKKHLPCRDYTGKMTQINSTQEAHIWTNQA